MSAALSQSEWGILESRYSLTPGHHDLSATRFVNTRDLMDKEKCESYLDRLGAEIGSPSRRVTASMLAKRYAALAVAPVLYAMTVFDKGLELTLDNCRLVSPGDSSKTNSKFPNLSLDRLSVTEPPSGNRQQWREHMVRQLFEGHLSQLFHSLSMVGRVPKAVLWENALVRIIPLYEDGLEEEADPSVLQRLHDDFKFITEEAPADFFGERRNPFSVFVRVKNKVHSDKSEAYVRQTCCFYYEMSPEYCRACPK